MFNFPILLISIIWPLISTFCIVLFSNEKKNKLTNNNRIIYLALFSIVINCYFAIYILVNFDSSIGEFQFIENYSLIPSIGLNLFLAVDGLSLFFIFLSPMLTLISVIIISFTVKKLIKELIICFLLLESFCLGTFLSLNLLIFYAFFEIILIPMYIIIGVWGGKNRVYAAAKFFIYTFFGSVFFLISIIYIYIQTSTFNIIELVNITPNLPFNIQKLLWLGIFFACAIKIPIIPIHTWLPDAHVQAPTAGSVMLAGILLKIGGYAILRILLPMFPMVSVLFSSYVLLLSAIAIIYASMIALSQYNIKNMIAYSSIAHMGYVTAAIFTFSSTGISAAIFQMISHTLTSSGLFLIIGMLYQRNKTQDIDQYGGVATVMPTLAVLFLIIVLASIGLPGLSGFIGEFFSILSVYKTNPLIGIILVLGGILGVIYMLKLYRDIMLGEIVHNNIKSFKDLSLYEKITLIPLGILIIYNGICPNYILTNIKATVEKLVYIF